jgi:hypothetical protein
VAIVVAVWGGTPRARAIPGLAPMMPELFGAPCESVAVFNGPSEAACTADSLGFDRWAHLSENAGVARAWNMGWQLSLAEIVCFVNEDVRAPAGGLRPLLDALDADPALGAVGPRGAHWDVDRMTHLDFVESGDDSPALCDAISGFALAVRRDALREVGGFDERFSPAGGEEIDLCFSLRTKGWSLGVVPCPEVEHEWGISARSQRQRVEWIGGNETLLDISARSRALLRAKWAGVDLEAGQAPARVDPPGKQRLGRVTARAGHLRRTARWWTSKRLRPR